nr:uncharacterized protein LOC126054691 [Helicoverpa armigera]
MSEVPEVTVEHCNGVDTEAEATDEANQNGDDGLAIDPKLGCRVHFPSDVIRETSRRVATSRRQPASAEHTLFTNSVQLGIRSVGVSCALEQLVVLQRHAWWSPCGRRCRLTAHLARYSLHVFW